MTDLFAMPEAVEARVEARPSTGETAAHRRLKRLAASFLVRHGCPAVAVEVPCPISRYRVDVAGYVDRQRVIMPGDAAPDDSSGVIRRRRWSRQDHPGQQWATSEPRTIMLECKQSRADFLRDGRDTERLLRIRERLRRICDHIERHRIPREEPDLRADETALFDELAEWDYARSRLPSYRRMLRLLRRVDRKLHGETKFCMIATYRLANLLYVVAPEGLVRRRELAPGWGLIECRADAMADDDPALYDHVDPPLRVVVPAPEHASPVRHRQRLLRNIAVAATRASLG
ncbi:MAG: hypothetical protein KDA25_04210 [Phycisphaerales bacterium]|nr:hypothetical protein [Phycisphaerales bacterium]